MAPDTAAAATTAATVADETAAVGASEDVANLSSDLVSLSESESDSESSSSSSSSSSSLLLLLRINPPLPPPSWFDDDSAASLSCFDVGFKFTMRLSVTAVFVLVVVWSSQIRCGVD